MNLSDYLKTNRISQAAFATQIGVTQGMVWQWLNNKRRIAAERVLDIEAATSKSVRRHEMRPDIYPPSRRARR